MAEIYTSHVLKGADAAKDAKVIAAEAAALLSSSEGDLGTRFGAAREEPGAFSVAHVWDEQGGSSQIRLVDEGSQGGKYFAVGADDKARCGAIAAVLARHFSFWTLPDLVAQARAATTDPRWITLAAMASNGTLDKGVLELITSALGNRATPFRNQAAVAAGLVEWPELLPALRAAQARELDVGVKTVLDFDIYVIESKAG